MKIMAVSDIHGDLTACEKALDKFKRSGADKLLILGDILYHGPRNDLPETYAPKKVIALLNEVSDKVMAVRGNCDAEVDQMVLQFPIMADYIMIETGDTTVFATHGHRYTPEDHPKLPCGAVFLSGHTHIITDEIRDGIRYLNPGSPSIPKDGSKPSCIMIEDGRFELEEL